jgi:hypothetical protein
LRRRGDIQTVTGEDPEYEILMAAPLLRELLAGDPMPLMDLVNRFRWLKLHFLVSRSPAYERLVLEHGAEFYERGDGLYPGHAMLASAETVALTREQLLREMVMVVNAQTITVHNLIDYVANAAGALHFGELSRHKRGVLEAIDRSFQIGGLAAAVHALKAVWNSPAFVDT